MATESGDTQEVAPEADGEGPLARTRPARTSSATGRTTAILGGSGKHRHERAGRRWSLAAQPQLVLPWLRSQGGSALIAHQGRAAADPLMVGPEKKPSVALHDVTGARTHLPQRPDSAPRVARNG